MKKVTFAILILLSQTIFSQKLTIIHTNDVHSNLTGYGPEASYSPLTNNEKDSTLGGFSRLAAVIKTIKNQNPDNTLVLDAGDFLMGTIFHTIENQTAFQIKLMKEIGYDYVCLGNHEFDMKPKFLAEAFLQAKKNGLYPKFIQSQLIFDPNATDDDQLEQLYNEKFILPYDIITKNNLKIGIFALLGKNAQFDAPTAKPVKFSDPISTAKKIVKILKNNNVDIIICLSHSGIEYDKENNPFFEDVELAKKVKDIDIIISGHTHVATPTPVVIGKTIIVQTGAYLHNVGKLEIEYKNNKANILDYQLIRLDNKILGDSIVQQEIEEYKKKVDSLVFQKLGFEYSTPICETSFILDKSQKNSNIENLGILVSDAIKYYTDNYSTGTDIVLVANGTIRDKILIGHITPADIFRVMPLGYGTNDYYGSSLAQIFINGKELKKLFELIIFASKPGEDSYLFFSGPEVYYNPNGGFLNKVKKVVINGQEIDFKNKNKLYSITANLYLLSFVGEIKKLSKGLIVIIPKDKNGVPIKDVHNHILDFDLSTPSLDEGKEWIAIAKYISNFTDTDNNSIPNIDEYYKNATLKLYKIK